MNFEYTLDNIKKCNESEVRNYEVTINFAGYNDCDEIYIIAAKNHIEAEKEALRLAKEEFTVTNIEFIGDREYEVTVQWIFMGCDETYTIYTDSGSEAEDYAIEEASMDLTAIKIRV